MAPGSRLYHGFYMNLPNPEENKLANNLSGAFTKSSSSFTLIFRTPTRFFFLKLTFILIPIFIALSTNNKLFKKFMEANLVTQD